MKKLFLLITISCLVSACSTAPTIIEKPAQFTVAPELVVKCPDLPPISDGKTVVTLGDLMTYNKGLQEQYINCAVKDDGLISILNNKVN
jgi:hypothetical protein